MMSLVKLINLSSGSRNLDFQVQYWQATPCMEWCDYRGKGTERNDKKGCGTPKY